MKENLHTFPRIIFEDEVIFIPKILIETYMSIMCLHRKRITPPGYSLSFGSCIDRIPSVGMAFHQRMETNTSICDWALSESFSPFGIA